MTLTVNSTLEVISCNSTDIPATGHFVLTSGLSRSPLILLFSRIQKNSRYSTIQIMFPVDFKDQHKNGVYYYSIKSDVDDTEYENGYIKIITDPGGKFNQKAFLAPAETENRESEVYFRPKYTP
tara:strand:+ start:365 stop:736 length:372 start_codon:yes stop_codon:yes gene_type:complete